MEEDQEWLAKALKGEEQSFRKLVEHYESLVYSTVVGMLGDVPEAKDVTQEVFIRFYKSMAQFRGEASLGTYLCRIAINLSINEQKRRQRRRWLSISKTPAVNRVVDKGESPGRAELRDTLKKAIQQLSPEFRAVVVLRLIDGYSVKEVAEILELPVGTIASRLSRAQNKLRKILKQWL